MAADGVEHEQHLVLLLCQDVLHQWQQREVAARAIGAISL